MPTDQQKALLRPCFPPRTRRRLCVPGSPQATDARAASEGVRPEGAECGGGVGGFDGLPRAQVKLLRRVRRHYRQMARERAGKWPEIKSRDHLPVGVLLPLVQGLSREEAPLIAIFTAALLGTLRKPTGKAPA